MDPLLLEEELRQIEFQVQFFPMRTDYTKPFINILPIF